MGRGELHRGDSTPSRICVVLFFFFFFSAFIWDALRRYTEGNFAHIFTQNSFKEHRRNLILLLPLLLPNQRKYPTNHSLPENSREDRFGGILVNWKCRNIRRKKLAQVLVSKGGFFHHHCILYGICKCMLNWLFFLPCFSVLIQTKINGMGFTRFCTRFKKLNFSYGSKSTIFNVNKQ